MSFKKENDTLVCFCYRIVTLVAERKNKSAGVNFRGEDNHYNSKAKIKPRGQNFVQQRVFAQLSTTKCFKFKTTWRDYSSESTPLLWVKYPLLPFTSLPFWTI